MRLRLPIRSRWLQISVRTLLLAVLVLSIILAVWTSRARRQEAIVHKVVRWGGGGVTYQHEIDAAGKRVADASLPGPRWLRQLIGNDAFFRLHWVGSNWLEDADLEKLTEFRSIELLQLGEKITDKGLAHLARLENLKTLDIESSKITDRGVKSLAGLRRLETLALMHAQITDEGLMALADVQSLKFINVEETQVTAAGVARLQEKLPQARIVASAPSIEAERQLVQALIRAAARFSADKEGWIKQVRFIGPHVTDDHLPVLARLKRLQTLALLNTRVTSAGIERLRASHPTLKVIPDFRTALPEETEALAALQQCGARVRHDAEGYVRGVEFTDETLGDEALASLRGLTRIESVIIVSPHITSEGLRHLEDLKSLETLWLWYSPVSDSALEKIKGMTNLKNLVMHGPEITDRGVLALKELKRLTRLTLKDTSITGATLQELQESDLEELDLGGSAIDDAGLKHLPTWPKLKRLNLTATKITDKGLRHLEGLESLESLLLKGTMITDVGLVHLQSLPALKSVSLDHTEVTQQGVQQFLNAKPGCKVHR